MKEGRKTLGFVILAVVLCIVVAICFRKAPISSAGTEVESEIGTETESTEVEDSVEESYEEIVIYEITADLTHDGIDDKIQTVLHAYGGDTAVDSTRNVSLVKVFCGKADGTYDKEAAYVSDYCSLSHSANETIILTEKDGMDYLMFSEMYEMQGEADYYFTVMYLGEDNHEVVVATNTVNFNCEEHGDFWADSEDVFREAVVPDLQEQMEPWIENGRILLALDVSTPVYISTKEQVYSANVYYDQIWSRSDREDYPMGTSYRVAYRDIIREYLNEYEDSSDRLRYSLIYFDDNDTPELVIGEPGYWTSIFTYDNGRIYPIIKEKGYGVGGNGGFLYIPRANVMYGEWGTHAGSISYVSFHKIDENYQYVRYYDKVLEFHCFNDLDGNGYPSDDEYDGNWYYFYDGKEITEEEFNSYLIGIDSLDEVNDVYLDTCPDKTLDEIQEELK